MTSVIGGGSVRTLADVGLKTNFQDGTLTIDSGKLGAALQANPQAINNIFSHATTGIGAAVQTLSDRYTNVVDGLFTTSTKSLNNRIKQMDTQADSMQARIDSFKANLTAQFTAMEQIVSGLKTTGNFLTRRPPPRPRTSRNPRRRKGTSCSPFENMPRLRTRPPPRSGSWCCCSRRPCATCGAPRSRWRAAAPPRPARRSTRPVTSSPSCWATLDHSRAPELCRQLSDLYIFVAGRLIAAGGSKNPIAVREAERVFAPIADAFSKAVAQLQGQAK